MTGTIAPPRPRATSYDVARRAGVSQSAVSRCFRDGTSISAKTRAKVLNAARALHYAPNKAARSLITQRSGIIAMLVSAATAENYPALLLHLGREIQAAGHRMLVCIGSTAAEIDAALADILGYHVDAVIAGIEMPETLIAACATYRIPVIAYNQRAHHAWASSVGCDDEAALDALAVHLRAGGSRRIGVIAGPPGAAVGRSRLQATRTAATRHRLRIGPVVHGDYSYDSGRRLAAMMMARRAPPPDTIVCANDMMALGALDACRHDLGLRVPYEIAIAGYDDIPDSGRPSCDLTTLAQPVGALTRDAMRLVRDRLAGDATGGERRLLPARLIIRGSTRPVG